MARTSKNPRGGAGLLFLTGLGIEIVVAVVAARTFLADAIADSGILPGPKVSDSAPAAPGLAKATVVDAEADAALAESSAICWGLAEPSDYGATITLTVTVGGGRVSIANVDGVSGALAACIEAEALEWKLTPTIQQFDVVRTLRLEGP